MSNSKRTFNGIVFADDYSKSFSEFKEEFGNTHVFKKIPSAERETKLKEAYKIATDGNISKPASESKETKSK